MDTRALVQHIRSKGAMNGIISTEITDAEGLKSSSGRSAVNGWAGTFVRGLYQGGIHLWLAKCEAPRGGAGLWPEAEHAAEFCGARCLCKSFPGHTSFEEMQEFKPHGYFVSNGPGDPAAMDYAVNTVKDILEAEQPMFGICLGQQLLARATWHPDL